MTNLLRDLQYGFRLLRKSPGFTVVAIFALAVGVGANITIFGFVNAILLRPLDAAEPERLIRAYSNVSDPMDTVASDIYLEYRDRNQSLSRLAMFHPGGLRPVRANGSLEMIQVMPVTGNYFEMLGVSAAMGRTIAPRDDDSVAPGVVMLGDACWRRHFGGDTRVLGETIFINKAQFTIIGIAPPSFRGTIGAPVVPQFYVPWNSPLGAFKGGMLIGRLKPGVSRGAAQADLSRIAAQLGAERHRVINISVFPAKFMAPSFSGIIRWFAVLFMIVVGVVLLIACDNIAMLMLARSAARRREFGIRLALGATRGQLLRQLLTECLLISAIGGLAAAFIAFLTARMLTQIYLPVPMPIALPFVFDVRVMAFTVVASLAATLLFGLGPALQSMKINVVSSLQAGTTDQRSRVRAGLVIVQVALSTALLVTAAVLLRSATTPGAASRGFSTDHVLMATVNLSGAGYSREQGTAFYARLQPELEKIPGVRSTNIVDVIPVATNRPVASVEMRPDNGKTGANMEAEQLYVNNVSPGHFRTLSIPLLQGRDFALSDDKGAPAVGIVNEALAQRFWPGENPIGRHLKSPDGSWIEVIGVARDSKYLSLDEAAREFLYRPLAQEYAGTGTVLIKTDGDNQIAAELRRKIAALDPNLLAYSVQPLEDRMAITLLANRAAAMVAVILGIVALGLGVIGTYGIMSFIVQQRRREMGVRMAVGASPANVVNLVTGQGMKWVGSGLAFGVIAAFAASMGLRRLMFGISPADPAAFLGVSALLAGTAYVACYIPARRASRIDPLVALREE